MIQSRLIDNTVRVDWLYSNHVRGPKSRQCVLPSPIQSRCSFSQGLTYSTPSSTGLKKGQRLSLSYRRRPAIPRNMLHRRFARYTRAQGNLSTDLARSYQFLSARCIQGKCCTRRCDEWSHLDLSSCQDERPWRRRNILPIQLFRADHPLR